MTAPASAPAASAGTNSLYEVSPADPAAAREDVFAVWREGGLEQTKTAELTERRYDWFYLQNPQGKACLSLLRASDESLVGSLGVGARQLFIDGVAHAAGVLVDFVVSPRHRSVFPALTLQRKGREQALQRIELLYGLPSPKAASVCKRLETQVSFQLPRYARVLHFRPYLQRLMPAWLATPASWVIDALDHVRLGVRLLSGVTYAEWVNDFDEGFDALWKAFDKSGQCIGVRNREFLHWRFATRPAGQYEILAIRSRSDDSLRAYFVCERSGTALSVCDCLSIGSENELVEALLRLGVAARGLGLASVDIRIVGRAMIRSALLRAGFSERSSQPFFAVTGSGLASSVAVQDWYLTQADEDV